MKVTVLCSPGYHTHSMFLSPGGLPRDKMEKKQPVFWKSKIKRNICLERNQADKEQTDPPATPHSSPHRVCVLGVGMTF